MRGSTLKMAGLSTRYIDLLPRDPHSAIFCRQTGGKTVFILNLLEGPYLGVFQHIVILYPTFRYIKMYQSWPGVWGDPEVYIVDPGERLFVGVLVNALAFSGSNFHKERKHHDKAVEQLQAVQAEWFRKWTECIDWINA